MGQINVSLQPSCLPPTMPCNSTEKHQIQHQQPRTGVHLGESLADHRAADRYVTTAAIGNSQQR
jgi:hypothetical protein